MPVIVGNNLVEPAPLVSISKELILAGNQNKLGQTYTVTIQGKLVGWMGSPQGGSLTGPSWGGPFGLFWQGSAPAPDENVLQFHKLYTIEAKQRALEALFAVNGQTIEWQSPDGSQPLKAQFKNARVTYPEGGWYQTCDYTITAECDLLYLNGNPVVDAPFPDLIQNATETWDIQPADTVKTFGVNHQVSAVGKLSFDVLGNTTQPAWMNARDFVNSRLTLGWSGASSFSPIAGVTIFDQSSLGSGSINLAGYSPYNWGRTEAIDEIGGSYSVTENWTAASASGAETYVVSTRKITEDPYTTIAATVQGTIKGFYDGLFNYDQRLPAAQYLYSQLGAPTGLLSRVTAFTGSGFQFNIQPIVSTIDYNQNEGSLSYAVEFSNRLFEMDSFEQYQVDRKTSIEDYKSTFTINGTIKGRRYDGDIDPTVSFTRALTQWEVVSTGTVLHDRIVSSRYFAGFSGLQTAPIDFNVSYNEGDGVVTYSYAFNNRVNDFNGSNNVQEDYQISKHFSVDDGITTYSLQGTILGLNVTDVNPRSSKYAAASGYFYNYAQPNAYSRVQQYFNVNLPNPNALVTEVAHFPVLGQITYSMEFRNTALPLLPGVLSEHITMNRSNYNEQVAVIGRIPIISRPHGDIIQDMNTTILKTLGLTIETVMAPATGASLVALFNTIPNYDNYALQLAPTNSRCQNWTDNFDPKNGRYSLNVEWVYQ